MVLLYLKPPYRDIIGRQWVDRTNARRIRVGAWLHSTVREKSRDGSSSYDRTVAPDRVSAVPEGTKGRADLASPSAILWLAWGRQGNKIGCGVCPTSAAKEDGKPGLRPSSGGEPSEK